MMGSPRGTIPFSPHKAQPFHCSHFIDEKTPAQRSLETSRDSSPTLLPRRLGVEHKSSGSR